MDYKLWGEFLKDHGNTVFNNWYQVRDFTRSNRIVRSIQNIQDDRVPRLINMFKTDISKSMNGTSASVQHILKINGFFIDLSNFKSLIINQNDHTWGSIKSQRNVTMYLARAFLPELPDNYMYTKEAVLEFIHTIKMSILLRKICWGILRIHKLENEESILNIVIPRINSLDDSLKLVNKDFLGVLSVKFGDSKFGSQLKADVYNVLATKVLNMTSYGKKASTDISNKGRKSYIMLLGFLRLDIENMYIIMLMSLKADGSLDSKSLTNHLRTRLVANPEVKQKVVEFYINFRD